MVCEKYHELINHITKEQDDLIPPYEHQLIEKILEEQRTFYAENVRTSQTQTSRSEPEALLSTNDEKIEPSTSGDEQNHQSVNTQDILNEDKINTNDDIDISEKEIQAMQARHTAMLGNKRGFIAYHYERLNRLKRLRWEYGNNLPREIVQNLTQSELEWFTKYNDILFSYMSALGDGRGIDLTLYMNPPKRSNVQFRCVKDYGQIDLDGKHILLKKDNLYFLPLSQCEKLIHQGVLEHIKT